MRKFKIESNVPVPITTRPMKYPLLDLKPKQSFFVRNGTRSALYASVIKVRKLSGNAKKQFAIRDSKENGSYGVRVWRVA